MITAKQANELREKAVENEIEEKRERASKFCEELSDAIETRAKEKYNFINIVVANEILGYVSHRLADNGYKVSAHTDNSITVQW